MWPAVEKLFGSNGACGGCWCMYWRIRKGEAWEKVKGPPAKARFREGVETGSVRAVLAFDGDEPVGWCTYGPRLDFPRLERARSLACADAGHVWSLPCFFVEAGRRGRGVAGALLKEALRSMKELGALTAEAYPSKPDKDGKYIAAFSWTGTRSLFAKAGFEPAGNAEGGKMRVRKELT
jgi:GNAT superfamily N-acetyltransferase